MTKKVYLFGRNSLDKARLHVQQHPEKNLVILKDSQTWRIAVCSPSMAEELKAKGFTPIAAGK